MDALLVRAKSTDVGTPGKLTLANGWTCATLELPWRGNLRGYSCIKPGTVAEIETYKGWIDHSNTLGDKLHHQVVRLENKNGRADCLIHNANWCGDATKGYLTQIHGCIAVGRNFGDIQRGDGVMQWGIMSSLNTLVELIEQLDGNTIALTIKWDTEATGL